MNSVTKAVVAFLTAAETVLIAYPNISWQQAVSAGIGTFLVWYVPNSSPKAAGQIPPPIKPTL